MSTINFKEETLEILKENGKTFDDVLFIQGDDFCVTNTKEEILKLMDFEYDNGFGGNYIVSDLKIVGKDFWLERHEYDGSEWWEFKQIPVKLPTEQKITTVMAHYGWDTLKRVHEQDE